MNLKNWWLAIRPKTLPAAVSPVLVGGALGVSDQLFSLWLFIAALTAALLIQIAVNLANDYFDFKHQIDTPDRKGPKRVTQAGLIRPETVRNAFILILFLAGVLAALLVIQGGPVIFAIAAAAIICAICYSAGPYPIASNGLGEVFVFIFFGPVAVLGTYYLMAQTVTFQAVAACVPVGLLITAIMVVNNLRDIETDARAGKRTLAVILGFARTKGMYVVLVLAAFLIPCLFFAFHGGSALILLPLATFPLAVKKLAGISQDKGKALNRHLGGTAQLSLWFSLLFSLGILWG